MRTNDETKMYKLYEERNRKSQMIQFISESIRRGPWLLNEGGAPALSPDPAAAGMDPAMVGMDPGAAGGEEDPLQPIIDQLSEMSSDELLAIIQKIVVAQQEKQAAMAAEGGAPGAEAGMEGDTPGPEAGGVPPMPPQV